MTEDIYKRIFSKNLRKYMQLNGKSQLDLINDLGFNKSSVSTWCNATRLPRMDKVDALANYFNISRSELIEDSSIYSVHSTENSVVREDSSEYNVRKNTPSTLAAHFNGDEYTEEELDEIKKFAEFIKNKRK